METAGEAAEETVTQGGTTEARGARRGTEKESCRQTDSFDSVRFELAGFGEYGSFVVRRGPRGCSLLSIPLSRSFLLLERFEAGNRAERNERATCQSCQTDAASQPEEKLSGNEREETRRTRR